MMSVLEKFIKLPFVQVSKDALRYFLEGRKVFLYGFKDGLVIYIGIFMHEEIPHTEDGLPRDLLVLGLTSVQLTRFR